MLLYTLSSLVKDIFSYTNPNKMLRTDTETRENQLLKVHKKLTDDVLAADLQWSLLVSAQASYRHDTVLKPAPPMFTADSDGIYDTEKLVCPLKFTDLSVGCLLRERSLLKCTGGVEEF